MVKNSHIDLTAGNLHKYVEGNYDIYYKVKGTKCFGALKPSGIIFNFDKYVFWAVSREDNASSHGEFTAADALAIFNDKVNRELLELKELIQGVAKNFRSVTVGNRYDKKTFRIMKDRGFTVEGPDQEHGHMTIRW